MPPSISFELFPPRTPESEARLWPALDRLAALNPVFFSVTCGAGGSGCEVTLDALPKIIARTDVPVAGHITCVGRSRAETDVQVQRYLDAGVRHFVALRGDAPTPDGRFAPHLDGYESSIELITAVRRLGASEVSVAAYPLPHPDSLSVAHDLDCLARKADAGATRALLQFCFDTGAIIELRDRIEAAGIALRVVPGVMLSPDFAALTRMATLTGNALPDWMAERFAGLEDDLPARRRLAASIASEQVLRLRSAGFDDFHFYPLNQSELAVEVCRGLGVTAMEPAVAA